MDLVCCAITLIIILAILGILKFFLKLVLWIIVAIMLLGGAVVLGYLFGHMF
jgi:hypothetical protein